jgi:hypothetical protein
VFLSVSEAEIAAHAAKHGSHTGEALAINATEPDDFDLKGPKRGPNAAHHYAKARELLEGKPSKESCTMAMTPSRSRHVVSV